MIKKITIGYIAINSVAHKQDLSEMKPEEVQSLLISNLKHTTRLESSGNQTVLRIIFQPLDKDKLMDDLEFDEDAKTWAVDTKTERTSEVLFSGKTFLRGGLRRRQRCLRPGGHRRCKRHAAAGGP